MTTIDSKLAIVGGGISGLYLSYLCYKHNIPFVLFEEQERLGGIIESAKELEPVAELGAHMLDNSYDKMIELIEEFSLNDQIVNKMGCPMFMRYKDKDSGIAANFSWSSLFANVWKAFFVGRTHKNVEQYFSAILGQKNYRNIILPIFSGLINQPAGSFPLSYFLPYNTFRNREYPKGFTFRNGLATIIEKMAQALPKDSVKLSTPVDRILDSDEGYYIEAGDMTISVKYCAVCTNVGVAARLLKPFNSLVELLERFEERESISVNVNLKADIRHKPFMVSFGREQKFYSIVSADPFGKKAQRNFTFHFDGKISSSDRMNEIEKYFHLSSINPDDVREKRHITPTIPENYSEITEKIEQQLKHHSGLLLSGNYINGGNIRDCMNRSFLEFSRLVELDK